jgi:5-methylthioadenosine/S-adenosylhomocysteine deaminase
MRQAFQIDCWRRLRRVGLAITGALLDGRPVGLRAEGGRIAELGPDVVPGDGDEAIDASDKALVPGLINGHTHAAMTLFRGYADDLPLMEWLEQHIWPAEARLDAEDIYWGTRLACVEMIRTGTTRFWDMYWRPEAVARAVADAGIRAVATAPLIDGPDPELARGKALEHLDAVAELASERIETGLAPHAIYTVGEDSLRWAAEIAAERGISIQIHLSETEGEVGACVEQHGVRPAFLLDRCGLLGPEVVLAHGVWLDEAELELIAERGATVVTNPVANMKLAVGGVFPYRRARQIGVEVGIGTDGAGSNNSLDLLADLKTFALLQKHVEADAAAVDATEAFEIACGLRSRLLGGQRLVVGGAADFLLADLRSPGLALGRLDAGLVYSSSGPTIATTVVAGQVLMRDGVIEGEQEVVSRAQERAQRLGLR